MAGYKIFQKHTYQEIVDTLAEIGITLTYDDTQDFPFYTLSFSDGKEAKFTTPAQLGYLWEDRWIFADDESHTFLFLESGGGPASDSVTPSSTATAFAVKAFIAEKEDGTLYSNNGYDDSSSLASIIARNYLNLPTLEAAQIAQNDPTLTELKLVPLAGNFYCGDRSATHPQEKYVYHVFKHAYVNYHRWFPFGTVIRGANGETFMGWGWILFRLGANS